MSTIDSTTPQRRPGSPRRRSDYAELLSRVRQAGLLDRRPTYYGIRIAINAALVVAGWTIFVLLGDSWWQLVTAVFLAVMFTQTGFIGHDAGHRQIFRSRRANDLVGLLHGNLAIGLAFGWWVDKHHRHHANPNQEGLDPDISGEAIVFTPAQARLRRGFGRFVARHQGLLFFPMLLLEGLNLHVASVRALFRSGYRERGREAVLLGLHTVGYLAVVIAVLSPLQALVFVVVQQGLFGVYLGLAFAPNHKGMPILAADDDTDFFRRQVLTSRNVRGNRLTDFLLGGLNHQIEHHLFPSMPRAALRHARPIVRAYCAERGVPYLETTLLDSYRQAVHHLHTVGRSAPHPDNLVVSGVSTPAATTPAPDDSTGSTR
ncbi:fatty acid desaturase family protein [Micromonospora sp. LOL_024]|uniref:fatty acid desaturase family protein n=1 Tax=Micromonospora sp. LOL_024 TaxID=3345412 RepID=UPI003A8C3F80